MATKAKIAKAKKQEVLIEQYRETREELKKRKDYAALAKLPKNSNPIRYRKRDDTDGRPRGYMGKFGLSRVTFRELAHQGLIPGVKKASW